MVKFIEQYNFKFGFLFVLFARLLIREFKVWRDML